MAAMQPGWKRVVLASRSPRRRALLHAACFDVEVRVPRADEIWPGGDVLDAAMALARKKLADTDDTDAPVVAADTLVVMGENKLGKPADEPEAIAMLTELAGRKHRVVTGFCVSHRGERRQGVVVTRVSFRPLSPLEIKRYVDTGEPFDKAGAYAIQGGAGAFVDRVEGSYTNVIGLPLREVIEAMDSLA